jgi:hypothetical protein
LTVPVLLLGVGVVKAVVVAVDIIDHNNNNNNGRVIAILRVVAHMINFLVER